LRKKYEFMAAGKNKQLKPKKPCFLIVDDDHQSLISLSSILKSFGSRVDAANCGSAALNCLSESRYDVVITDLEMKDSNGCDLARQVKDKFPKIRTIIMSEQNHSRIGRHIERTIVDGYITKPFTMSDLLYLAGICNFYNLQVLTLYQSFLAYNGTHKNGTVSKTQVE